jgi:hypothetical protein
LSVVETGPAGVGVLVGGAGVKVNVGRGVAVAESSATEEHARLKTRSVVNRNINERLLVFMIFS